MLAGLHEAKQAGLRPAVSTKKHTPVAQKHLNVQTKVYLSASIASFVRDNKKRCFGFLNPVRKDAQQGG